MPFAFDFGFGDGIDDLSQFDVDFSESQPDPGAIPTGNDEDKGWLEITYEYIESGLDTLGDATDILETWGIIGGNGDRRDSERDFSSTAQGWVDNLSDWARSTFGTTIGKESATQMLPWVLGGLAVIAVLILVKR